MMLSARLSGAGSVNLLQAPALQAPTMCQRGDPLGPLDLSPREWCRSGARSRCFYFRPLRIWPLAGGEHRDEWSARRRLRSVGEADVADLGPNQATR
jgi:hypothetical protein